MIKFVTVDNSFFSFGKQTVQLTTKKKQKFKTHFVKIHLIEVILKNIKNVHRRTNKRKKISILSEAQLGKTISTSIHFSKTILYLDLLEARNQQPTIIQDRGDDIVNIRKTS